MNINNFSFIKFVELKEKKYRNYEKILQLKKVQVGGDKVELFTIQNELLKIKKKISNIESSRKNVVLDPYDKLKDLIDSINSKVNKIEGEINSVGKGDDKSLESKNIINRLRDIDILIDSSAADYKGIQVDRKLQFVKERIDPEQLAKISDKYINDTSQLVNDLRNQLGGVVNGNLVKNEEINKNINDIEAKIKAYDDMMAPITGDGGIISDIKEYINQMESLYLGNQQQTSVEETGNCKYAFPILLMDKNETNYTSGDNKFLIEPKDDEKDKILVVPQSDADKEFSYYQDLVDTVDKNTEENALISSEFIKTDTNKQDTNQQDTNQTGGTSYNLREEDIKVGIEKVKLNTTMENLYKTWKNNINLIRIENKAILQYQLIVDELKVKIMEIENFLVSYDTISEYISSDLSEKMKKLNIDLVKAKENLQNCNLLISNFKETKIVNSELSSKCTLGDNLDLAIIEGVKKELETKRKDLLEKIELTNSRLSDKNYIDSLVSEKSPEEKVKKEELEKLYKQFFDIIKKATLDIKIQDKLIEIVKNNKYSNINKHLNVHEDKNKDFSAIEAFIKFRDAPITQTERTYSPVIKSIEKKINFIDFLKDINRVQKELLSFQLKNPNEIIAKMNKVKQSLEEHLNIINKFLNKNAISIQIGGEDRHLNDFINKLSEFEMKIREMKNKRNEVKKLTKKYNVRYSQFMNFQKYIVTYVSLVLAQKEYEYWNLISKGSISFYENILKRLEEIVDKFENPSLFKEENYKTDENKWFYTKHFFMIKILRRFFSELYAFWDYQDCKYKESTDFSNKSKEIKKELLKTNPWNLKYKLNTLANIKSSSVNKNYFFLFNIFFTILDAYQMKLPPVANYMRINFNDGVAKGNETFTKDTKNFLKSDNILKCFQVKDSLVNGIEDPDAKYKSEAVKNIKFEEIFDPDNFQENDALAMYMGLGNMLNSGKSVMLLTYGYSGVGKTFTLFGTKGIDGMLQSTLNGITGSPVIEMKAFELYGLGVPYKFYWEANNFTHCIYHYDLIDRNSSDSTKINPNPSRIEKDGFDEFLKDLTNNAYTSISNKQIKNFKEIVENIDTIRKETGRIKATINNPESSRSIMIYDFKIKLANSTPRLVVMDLPGKENLYQTYCERDSLGQSFEPKPFFFNHRPGPGKEANSNRYDKKMIKSMMYINPLWLGMVPEIAEHFDDTQKGGDHLINSSTSNSSISVPTLTSYGIDSETQEHLQKYKDIHPKLDITNITTSVFTSIGNKSHLYIYPNGTTKQGLYGLTSRAIAQITNMINQDNGLEKLGAKINDMLVDDKYKAKRYGYAGLEGIYINENILGLLEVLSEKIQKNRDKSKPTVSVVCSQNEIYKKIIANDDSGKLPIGWKELIDNGTVVDGKFKENPSIIVKDNEFISQIMVLRNIIKSTGENKYIGKEYFEPSANDNYNNYLRNSTNMTIDNSTKGLSDNLDDITKNWINNYDYNKIFNIKNPPIKSVLAPYLDDESFKNFYLFFVTSNNVKEGNPNIDTCSKQIQLMYDTRHFMDVIANPESKGIGKCSI